MRKLLAYIISSLMVLGYSAIATADLNDGLIAYWSFDDCTFNDESYNHFNGEIYGDLECVNGIHNNAFRFKNLSKVKVSKDLLNGLDTLTINFWIKTTDRFACILSVANSSTDNEFGVWLARDPFQQLSINFHLTPEKSASSNSCKECM